MEITHFLCANHVLYSNCMSDTPSCSSRVSRASATKQHACEYATACVATKPTTRPLRESQRLRSHRSYERPSPRRFRQDLIWNSGTCGRNQQTMRVDAIRRAGHQGHAILTRHDFQLRRVVRLDHRDTVHLVAKRTTITSI